jgi:hypothetical protein
MIDKFVRYEWKKQMNKKKNINIVAGPFWLSLIGKKKTKTGNDWKKNKNAQRKWVVRNSTRYWAYRVV